MMKSAKDRMGIDWSGLLHWAQDRRILVQWPMRSGDCV